MPNKPAHARAYRASIDEHGRVACTCWCELTTVRIPAHWLGHRTLACDQPYCQTLQDAYLTQPHAVC